MATITEPAGKRFQLVLLRAHLKLHKQGLKNSRVPLKKFLEAARVYTGKSYTRNQVDEALKDIQAEIDKENQNEG